MLSASFSHNGLSPFGVKLPPPPLIYVRSLLKQSFFHPLGQNCLKSVRSVLRLLINVFRNSIIFSEVVCWKNMRIMRKVQGIYSCGKGEFVEEPRSCKGCPWDVSGTGDRDVHIVHGRTKVPHGMSTGCTGDRTSGCPHDSWKNKYPSKGCR